MFQISLYSVSASLLFVLLLFIGCHPDQTKGQPSPPRYVEVSKNNPSYFSLSDGSPYIPVGINMINPSSRTHENPDSAFYEIEQWMKNLSENGGNYVRVWLSESFWDIEDQAQCIRRRLTKLVLKSLVSRGFKSGYR